MKVRRGTLTDADRELIVRANRDAKNVLVAASQAFVDDTLTGRLGTYGPDQYTGIPQHWDYDTLTLGPISRSFTVRIEWDDIRAVWLLDDAPSSENVIIGFLPELV